MKAGTETKLKFKALRRVLELPLWQATGLLEALWRATEANAPAGDIGRLTNEEIAASIEWGGDANHLIETLVSLRWLDRDDDFRLIVHDWSDHVPNYLKGAFAKHGKQFANDVAKQKNNGGKILPSTMLEQRATNPILSKPIQNQSNPPPPGGVGGRAAADFVDWNPEERKAAIQELADRGLDRAVAAVNDAERLGISPEAFRDLLFEYDENRSKFRSPGAISDRIRHGAWPAAGVLNGEQAAAKADGRAKKAEADEMAGVLFRTVNRLRKAQVGDDQIKLELRKILPTEFLEREGW